MNAELGQNLDVYHLVFPNLCLDESYLKGSSNFNDSISKLALASWLIYLGDSNIDWHWDN